MVFLIFGSYLKAYFSYIFRLDNRHGIAFRHLIHRKTHRIPLGSHKSIKTAFSLLYRRVFSDILSNKPNPEMQSGDTCFYNESIENWAIEYVKKSGHERTLALYLTPYNAPLNGNILMKTGYAMVLFFIVLISLPVLLIRPVALWALHITVLHEHARILSQIKRQKVNHFYDFISYELGSSFLNLLLMKQGVNCYCITSPTPLYETYPDYVCDHFLSTSPYHYEEIEYKKAHPEYPLRFRYEKISIWPYNEFDDKLEFNTGNYSNKKSLGVYVSGVWWRSMEKHQEYANGFFESEFLLLDHIRTFALKYPIFNIILFLHPKERKTEEQRKQALAFYTQKLEGVTFQFGDFSRPTKSQFSRCDISVSVSSNTTYERLYGGFKSLFTPYYLPKFPIDGSNLNHMCCKSYDELEQKILTLDGMTDEAYFEQFSLREYHHQYAKFGEVTNQKN